VGAGTARPTSSLLLELSAWRLHVTGSSSAVLVSERRVPRRLGHNSSRPSVYPDNNRLRDCREPSSTSLLHRHRGYFSSLLPGAPRGGGFGLFCSYKLYQVLFFQIGNKLTLVQCSAFCLFAVKYVFRVVRGCCDGVRNASAPPPLHQEYGGFSSRGFFFPPDLPRGRLPSVAAAATGPHDVVKPA